MLIYLEIINIEEEKIYLQDKEGQKYVFPKNKFSENLNIGDQITLYLKKDVDEEKDNLPKDILNEFLNLEENKKESNEKNT